MKKWIIIGALAGIVIITGIIYIAYGARKSGNISYRTVPVQHGDLVCTIAATGTVEPEELVDVGAQVAGRIVEFGKDKAGKTIDYNSKVEAGTVLAKIDDVLFQCDLLQAQGTLEQAKASLLKSEADLNQYKAQLILAESNYRRAERLRSVNSNSIADFDTAKSAYETAKANVTVAEAGISQSEANLTTSESMLKRAKQNLEYCTIRSPVKGVIIDCRVNIGQTVVASLSAPSLFLIAKDLSRMEVWATVNEADVGKIHIGEPVTFTVDAYPGETFKGTVEMTRLNASVTQNVVTYQVVVSTDNSNGKLLPYLTANLKFETARRANIFMVTNSALRWMPDMNSIDESYKNVVTAYYDSKNENSGEQSKDTSKGLIWLLEKGKPVPLDVKVGIANDTMTEIEGNGLKDGTKVIVGVMSKAGTPSTGGNPFIPQMGNRQNRPMR